jgi:hypothetical protein
MLSPGAGHRLFGILQTEFLACTFCGAKFVPEQGKYRLVSVAKKHDPLRAQHLIRSYTPDEWSAVAYGKGATGIRRGGRAGSGNRKPGSSNDTGTVSALKNGLLGVPFCNRTLYFTPLELQFGKGSIRDLFSKRKEPLKEILNLPAYRHLAAAGERYAHYLDVPAGLFLLELKTRRDNFYRSFLNLHGDAAFCTFRAAAGDSAGQCGVYVASANGTVMAAGTSFVPFRQTIDEELGHLSPETCYLDGDPVRCRINALVCSQKKKGGGFYIHPVEDDGEIDRVGRKLSGKYGTGILH